MRACLRVLALILPTALPTVLVGCGPEGSRPAASFLGFSLGQATFESTAESTAGSSFTTYSSVRRYTDYVGVLPGEYTESFIQADEEHFRINLLTLNGLARNELADPASVEQFDRLQSLFQGGRGRYNARGRDFRLKDLGLFLANYSFVVYDTPALVAGRLADVVEVTPRFGDRPSYTVWIDRETLVTLKYLEFQQSGALAAEMEVLEIDYQPDLSGVRYQQSAAGPATELKQGQAAAFASFDLLRPTYLPRGFVWQSTRARQLGGTDTLTFTYSDGLQELGLVQYKELNGESQGSSLPTRVGLTMHGPTTDAGFAVIGTQVHVTGKLDAEEVMSLIESLDVFVP